MSEKELTIQQALSLVMIDVGAIRKQEKNTHQGFVFRGIDTVVKAVYPALVKHGVVVLPNLIDMSYSTVEIGAKRTPMGHCQVTVEYNFIGPAGDVLTARVAAEAMDSGDKATAKAMSVAFRTALLQSLCLPTDDPDPDSDSYERTQRESSPKGRAAKVVADNSVLLTELGDAADRLGQDMLTITNKFRTEQGGLTMEEFNQLPPDRLRGFVRQVVQYAAKQGSSA